jgi:CHASE2 domain-containing sensor protein
MQIKHAFFFVLFVGLVGCSSCQNKKVIKELAQTNQKDSDIILFNIRNDSRAEIADLLSGIENCHPLVIGIDVIFSKTGLPEEDSLLRQSIVDSSSILAYRLDSTGLILGSNASIKKINAKEGFIDLNRTDGIVYGFTPIRILNGKKYNSFALQIVHQWKPDFQAKVVENKSMPILFQRKIEQFNSYVKEDLQDEKICNSLKGKVVLVGFLGPGEEDKQLTPLGQKGRYPNQIPDMYGLVIQANAIRTILYNK